jgi:hypothetical protein
LANCLPGWIGSSISIAAGWSAERFEPKPMAPGGETASCCLGWPLFIRRGTAAWVYQCGCPTTRNASPDVDSSGHLYHQWNRRDSILRPPGSADDFMLIMRPSGALKLRFLPSMRRRIIAIVSGLQARRGIRLDPLRLLRHGVASLAFYIGYYRHEFSQTKSGAFHIMLPCHFFGTWQHTFITYC